MGKVTTGPGLAQGPVDRSRKVKKEKQGNAPSLSKVVISDPFIVYASY